MTPPRTYPYAIYYNDGSYMVYDLTRADFDQLTEALVSTEFPIRFVKLSIGLLCTFDIRSIIEQRESEEQEELPSADPGLSLSELHYLTTLRGSEV